MKKKIIIADTEKDRYASFNLVDWWDQEKLKKAWVMVVGAGALGNEVLKNLALLGVGNIYLIDFDSIQNSDLSRSVLYRQTDNGKEKAQVAAQRVKEINPDIHIEYKQGNIIWDVGLGVFRQMDVVIGCLDNREARLAVNYACYRMNIPFIDGGIDVLTGQASFFIPDKGACYECTLTDIDYQILGIRYSCPLLEYNDLIQGKVPTTPTTASIIAGIQTQEALKLIHHLQVPAGKGFVYNGITHDCYLVQYPVKKNCLSHEHYQSIIELKHKIAETTFYQLLTIAEENLGKGAVIELDRDIILSLRCNKCNTCEDVFKIAGRVSFKQGKCPECNEARMVDLTYTIDCNSPLIEMKIGQVGIPPGHIIRAKRDNKTIYLEFTGDIKDIFRRLKDK